MTLSFKYHLNRNAGPVNVPNYAGFDPGGTEDAFSFHRSLPGYEPTPLINLPMLAQDFGICELWVKDEAHRFGTKAFKALGASYAIHRYLQENPGEHVFCTATDGNHGMAVAWSARIFEKRAEVFMPRGTVPVRIRRIEDQGARVTIVDGDYDETVRTAADEAKKHGWVLIQDTSWEGYSKIPALIMAGYLTMFHEMEGELFPPDAPGVDVVFLQAGVGSWAASAVLYLAKRYAEWMPKVVCVEPLGAGCCLESARMGALSTTEGSTNSIMAGLNCGTPSLLAWPILAAGVDLFLAIPDAFAVEAMRTYYHPKGADTRTVSGESGAAGLGALLALVKAPELEQPREELGLGGESRILLFNTEGDTDPVSFRRIVGEGN